MENDMYWGYGEVEREPKKREREQMKSELQEVAKQPGLASLTCSPSSLLPSSEKQG
jgi:hypothetical protein